jgi:hypothetical protein
MTENLALKLIASAERHGARTALRTNAAALSLAQLAELELPAETAVARVPEAGRC